MGMPWEFYPKTKTIDVHPGENNKIFFYAKNPTGKDMSVQAIPSMTPTEALSHFHKIQCFCFTQQTLKAHQSRDMPMIFRIDNDIPKDIHVISLAYTLFDTTPKERNA
jgi:cytochrome c oxidase assembly protein subunit 11